VHWVCRSTGKYGCAGKLGEYMEKSQQNGDARLFARLITERRRIVWLAGQTGFRDEQGKEMVGFDAQARQAFRGIDASLKKAAAVSPTW